MYVYPSKLAWTGLWFRLLRSGLWFRVVGRLAGFFMEGCGRNLGSRVPVIQ